MRPLLPPLLISALLLLAPAWSGRAASADLDQIKELDAQVHQRKKDIEQVQSGLSGQRDKAREAKQREQVLLEELAQLERRIGEQSAKLAGLEEQMARQDALTREKEEESKRVEQSKEQQRRHMEQRLAAYYRMGEIGLLNAAFAAESLSDLLNLEDNFRFMAQHDRQVISAYKKSIKELEAARAAHEREKAQLASLASQVREQRNGLEQSQQQRLAVLEQVKVEKALYLQAVAELEKAEHELTRTLKQLQKQAQQAKDDRELQLIRQSPLEPFKKRKPASARGIAALKGSLPAPAAGHLVRAPRETSGKDAATATIGIDIDCAPGSEVRAVYDGTVVYVGAMRGYGNLIIIDHGNHYYTLISGVGDTLVKVGDTVKQHDHVGLASLHTGQLRELLHFEIRYKTEAQNPMEWLDMSQFAQGGP